MGRGYDKHTNNYKTMNDIYGVFKDNPSARKLIGDVYQKAEKEGKYVGYWSRKFTELTGIEPSDEKSGYDAGNEPQLINNE